eukprot:TRINITY_DN35612_c0_g1_i1.p1 TRINITY_DN35612_c0_g1~~TRINITY_DN35612_c0_g1_i1.p1  ORF type:complete len:173 (+),score=16.79 TRINITY_DN35612_c0_g1_i1:18-536(+)
MPKKPKTNKDHMPALALGGVSGQKIVAGVPVTALPTCAKEAVQYLNGVFYDEWWVKTTDFATGKQFQTVPEALQYFVDGNLCDHVDAACLTGYMTRGSWAEMNVEEAKAACEKLSCKELQRRPGAWRTVLDAFFLCLDLDNAKFAVGNHPSSPCVAGFDGNRIVVMWQYCGC